MNLWFFDVCPLIALLLARDLEPAIPFSNQLTQPLLLSLAGETHHQFRSSQWQLVPSIHLPEMIRLPVQPDHILHLLGLRLLPYSRR